MRNYCRAIPALLGLAVWTSLASGQQRTEAIRDSKGPAQGSRVCSLEKGVNVCRDASPAERDAGARSDVKPPAAASTGEPKYPGKLLVLLDIPSNIFIRLADDPADNRMYHAVKQKEYRPAPPAPLGAGEYSPPVGSKAPAWKYHPEKSFEYRAKRDWTYDRDVYGRLWRANIEYAKRVLELPFAKRGVYLFPVGDPQS